jgi:hypothetical protein
MNTKNGDDTRVGDLIIGQDNLFDSIRRLEKKGQPAQSCELCTTKQANRTNSTGDLHVMHIWLSKFALYWMFPDVERQYYDLCLVNTLIVSYCYQATI